MDNITLRQLHVGHLDQQGDEIADGNLTLEVPRDLLDAILNYVVGCVNVV